MFVSSSGYSVYYLVASIDFGVPGSPRMFLFLLQKPSGEKGVSPFAPIRFGKKLAQNWHKVANIKKWGSVVNNCRSLIFS